MKIVSSVFLFALFFSLSPIGYAENVDNLKAKIKALEAENERLKPRTKITEKVIPRSFPPGKSETLIVYIPENASNLQIKAFMKNEPWGGHQNPPKPNTDGLGSSHYHECPMGTGECLGWAKVSSPQQTSISNGRIKVQATFTNWAHRNDRTGKLQVTYQID